MLELAKPVLVVEEGTCGRMDKERMVEEREDGKRARVWKSEEKVDGVEVVMMKKEVVSAP